MRTVRILIAAIVALLALAACDTAGDGGGDEAEPSVEFVTPQDGDEVTSPVEVEMEAEGITIEPADAGVNEGAGHFHIMVDTDCVTPGEVMPGDDQHRHFGNGATSAELELEPGEHTLCLQVGDGEHRALEPTDEITITVTDGGEAIPTDGETTPTDAVTPTDGDTTPTDGVTPTGGDTPTPDAS